MQAEGVRVTGIPSDSSHFQIASSSSRNAVSIQAIDLEWSKLILVPDICHRGQKSTKKIFKKDALSTQMISLRLIWTEQCKFQQDN
jgi:hypothetical protein